MPYLDPSNVYVLDNTGVQVDNSVDYANANSNRNLLDNWYFPTAVNQRGFTSTSSANTPTIDRWKNLAAYTVTYSNGCISIPANGVFGQNMEPDLYAQLVGKTVTLSALYSNGTIVSGSMTVPSTGGAYAPGTPRMGLNGDSKRFYIYPNSNVTIKAFKLELGSYSTLINDVQPNYAEELAKCQYYYREINCNTSGYAAIGYATAATQFRVPFPYRMRVRPSVAITGTLTGYYEGGSAAVTAVTVNGYFTDVVQVVFGVAGGLTAGRSIGLVMADGAKITFSAEL